jgi:hypothetical protein
MRDAAALIILQMDKATGISKLSAATRSPGSIPEHPAPMQDISGKKAIQTTVTEDSSDDSGI